MKRRKLNPRLRRSLRPAVELLEDRRLLAQFSLVVNGDSAREPVNDDFVLHRLADEGHSVEVLVNGVQQFVGPIDGLAGGIQFNGLDGNDTLVIDFSNGNPIPAGGLDFDGGAGFNRLTLESGAATSDAYTPGLDETSGNIVISAGAIDSPATPGTIHFENLAPVLDLVPSPNLQVNGTPADNAINYMQGSSPANGLVTIDNFEPIEFSNKDTLTINGQAGSDAINLNNPSVPNGLTPGGLKLITVQGDDPTGSDTLIANAVPGVADQLFIQPTSQGAGVIQQLTIPQLVATHPNIDFGGIEHLTLVGQSVDGDTFGVDGTTGDDSFVYTVGSAPDSGTVTGSLNGTVGSSTAFPLVPIAFSGMNPTVARQINFATRGGADSLAFQATNADDLLSITHGTINLGFDSTLTIADSIGAANFGSVIAAKLTTAIVDGGSGNDVFSFTAADCVFSTPPVVTLAGGDAGGTGDSLSYVPLADAAVTLNLGSATDTGSLTSSDPLTANAAALNLNFTGIAHLNLTGTGMASTLIVTGTAGDDVVTLSATAAGAGSFRVNSTGAAIASSATVNYSAFSGPLAINGSGGFDELALLGTPGDDRIDVNQTSVTALAFILNSITQPLTLTNMEGLRVEAGDGNDIVRVTPGDLLASNLRFTIHGGTGTDRLAVVDAGVGDLLLYRKGTSDDAGSITVGPANPIAPPVVNFDGIETVNPVTAAGGALAVLQHDPYEYNDDMQHATHLGVGQALNVEPNIDPGTDPTFNLPGDQDWYRVEADTTGTLDFQLFFHEIKTLPSSRPGLPFDGDLDLRVFDVSDNLIAASTSHNDNERVRIPGIQGQVYYMEVSGFASAINSYAVSVINSALPVPYNLELDDTLPNPSDTGRSQLDNVTDNNKPTIFVRLDDAVLRNDLPGNGTAQDPPKQVIPIPFNTSTNVATTDPGFRVPVFDENNANLPVLLGFAQPVAGKPGVYSFTFVAPLSDGSHFITSRVQMIDGSDLSNSPGTIIRATGFGDRSAALEINVDTQPPPVFFGSASSPTDGLDSKSDSGVGGQPSTNADRITNVTMPSFSGVAEANAIVRLYVDMNGNGMVDAGDLLIGQTLATPQNGTNVDPNGQWNITSTVDLNDPALFPSPDGTRVLMTTAEDLAGNVSAPQFLAIFLDTQGPRITSVSITGSSGFNLFAPKPNDGPTPLVNAITISLQDQPNRAPNSLYGAINAAVAANPALYVVRGDVVGVIPVSQVVVVNNPVVAGQPATATIQLVFAASLPDDRYTLTVSDRLVDDPGNALDGGNDAVEPVGTPVFPTGDGQPGGSFIGRFTVDSRPEIATVSSGSVFVDLNGNGTFDPQSGDQTNRDAAFRFGLLSDAIFAGNFAAASAKTANGFSKLGAYGKSNGVYRWLLDLTGDGVYDVSTVSGLQINGLPVAGDFDPSHPGDEIGLFSDNTWYLDTNGNNNIDAGDAVIHSDLRGLPIVGDFDGDGKVDLATYQPATNTFFFDLAFNGLGGPADAAISFGFAGVGERPVAADFNMDGVTDIGLYVPSLEGVPPRESADWYIVMSQGRPLAGSVDTLAHAFDPQPLGLDLYIQGYGDLQAAPLVGNFDPPVGTAAPSLSTIVGQAYQQFLQRDPDTTGIAYWSQQIVNGILSDDDFVGALLGSQEYYALHGSTSDGFLTGLYHDVMGRQPTASELAQGEAALSTGTTRAALAQTIFTSPEAQNNLSNIAAQFQQDVGTWVTKLYEDTLQRTPGQSESLYWSKQVTSGQQTRDQVASAILNSTEKRSQIIEGLYEQYLGRPADDGGMQYWLGLLAHGGRQEDLQTLLLNSPEFYAKNNAAGTAEQFVQNLYQSLFQRLASVDEVDYWVQVAGQTSRAAVIQGFITSAEQQRTVVRAWFDDFLGRPADSGAIDYFGQLLLNGQTREQIEAALLASAEYWQRVH